MRMKLMLPRMLTLTLLISGMVSADWQRLPASDVDKEFISGNPGLAAGLPPTDNSCWIATASNLLAGAGYGNGSTFEERAEDIYIDMLTWQRSEDPAGDPHGTRDGGWTDTALTWWLSSANNIWPANPYNVVTVYGNKTKVPWANANGAQYVGNQLREFQQVGLSISKPRTTAGGSPSGGHAITAWGDDGTWATLATNPGEVIVADSDRDTSGTDFQTYTYDGYTNPNPGLFNEGNGWYFNFSTNHWFIKHIATLCPADSPVDPYDGPTQKCVGSYKIRQNSRKSATDLHYTAWTDYDILAYQTEIDWPTINDPPVINESNTHRPALTRSDIHVDWDLTDNPVPWGTDVTITTEFILQNWNGLWYDDVHFTYPGKGPVSPKFGWDVRAVELPNTNIRDITGGYLVGSFEIFDVAGEQNLLGQYRFVHQYPYTQDPERHTFSIRGPEGQGNCEYIATNFRFGHLYGMPNTRELWEFSRWMTVLSDKKANLCSSVDTVIEIDWEGRLPYPASNITPAHELPDPLDCTVYLDSDLNKDCCVDLRDFILMANEWLQCTSGNASAD